MVRGVGKRGCGRGLDGGQSEGGGRLHGADAAGVGDVKGRSQKVARLQASEWAGLIHCPWLGCLYVSISWFRLVP